MRRVDSKSQHKIFLPRQETFASSSLCMKKHAKIFCSWIEWDRFMARLEWLRLVFGTIWISSTLLCSSGTEIHPEWFCFVTEIGEKRKKKENRHFPHLRLLLEFPPMMSSQEELHRFYATFYVSWILYQFHDDTCTSPGSSCCHIQPKYRLHQTPNCIFSSDSSTFHLSGSYGRS